MSDEKKRWKGGATRASSKPTPDFDAEPMGKGLGLMFVDMTAWDAMARIGAERGLRPEQVLSLAMTEFLERNGYDPSTGEKR